jgi:ABC-type multidrug transport system fused ATPase/permease subunit
MKTIKKIYELLTPPEKQKFFILLGLVIVMAFLDMIGVASIFPFITILINPQLIETNIFLSYLYKKSSLVGINSTEQFLFLFGVVVFLLLIISLIVRALTQYNQLHFVLMREYSIGRRLIEGYLHQSYTWFLNRHSANLGKNILSEVNIVVNGTLLQVATIITQTTVSLALLILLIIIDPILAISSSLVLIICYVVIFHFIKKILHRLGSERLKINDNRFITVTEAFSAAKEIKLGGLEQVYINRFAEPAKLYANSQSLAQTYFQLPRYLIEGIAFGGMILLILVLMARGNGFENIVPILAIYAFVGYRLMPAMQSIFFSIGQIRFSKPALDYLHKDLENLKFESVKNYIPAITFKKNINLNNISFYYPGSKYVTLKGINMTIPAFSKVGIIGATGSGKTTTVDLILGLLDPSEGTLSVDGNVIDYNNKRSWQKSIGYVPQQIFLSDNSIAVNIAFGVNTKNIDYQAVEQAAKIANLHDFIIKEMPKQYDTIIGERGVRLSGGQRQRIGIARALYHKPQILILDEATSALDNLTEDAVIETIYKIEKKITIIQIAHRLRTVQKCNIIFVLDKGELKAQGTYIELSKSNELFKKI